MARASAVQAVKAAVDLTVIDRGGVVDKYQLVADPTCFQSLVEDMVPALARNTDVVVAVETGGIFRGRAVRPGVASTGDRSTRRRAAGLWCRGQRQERDDREGHDANRRRRRTGRVGGSCRRRRTRSGVVRDQLESRARQRVGLGWTDPYSRCRRLGLGHLHLTSIGPSALHSQGSGILLR